MKKFLNTLSYLLNLLLIAALIYVCYGNKTDSNEDKIRNIKSSIVEKERAEIPMKVQEFEHVFGITVDSLVLTNNIEPYTGYLVTEWDIDEKQNLTTDEWWENGRKDKYIRKTKTVYVEISNITLDGKAINWNDKWHSAYYDIRENK